MDLYGFELPSESMKELQKIFRLVLNPDSTYFIPNKYIMNRWKCVIRKFIKCKMIIRNAYTNKDTDRTLDVFFSRFRDFSSSIILRQKPKGVTRMPRQITRQRERMRLTPLGHISCFIVLKCTCKIKAQECSTLQSRPCLKH